MKRGLLTKGTIMSGTTVENIDICFEFHSDEWGSKDINETFDPADSALESTIGERANELLDELNDGIDNPDEMYTYIDYTIDDYDGDFANPSNFTDLDEYGEYAEKVEEHGEAYHLRYEDIGDNRFDEQYRGCWDDIEDFVRHEVESCHDIPSWVEHYIDWERMARDHMMDYSSYDGNEGTHIFSDH